MVNKFKNGDKVRQIEESKYRGHNFPVSEYPEWTVILEGSELRSLGQADDYCHMSGRFELIEERGVKDTNPKESVGIKKAPMSTVSGPAMAEVGVAMLEGARKYGRHNYRVSGIKSSVYYDAAMRHLMAWWEGEDIDPDSGLSHITKAQACLMVLRDAQISGMENDDRPPKSPADWKLKVQEQVDEIFEKYPESVEAHTATPPKAS